MEGLNGEKLCAAAAFHDLHESRLLDLHKIATNYIDEKSAEKRIEGDQLKKLPSKVNNHVRKLLYELNDKEILVLKDSDYL